MIPKKLYKKSLLPLLILTIFILSTGISYAFTVIQPEHRPPTPAERKAMERKKRGEKTFPKDTTPENQENGFTTPNPGGNSPAPQVNVTKAPEQTQEQPKPQKTEEPTPIKKGGVSSKFVVFTVFGLLILAMAAWYFTRNVNFGRLFK